MSDSDSPCNADRFRAGCKNEAKNDPDEGLSGEDTDSH